MTAWSLVRRTLRRRARPVAAAAALLVSWQVCEALVPVAIGLVIDRAVATSDTRALLLSGLGLTVLFAVLSYSYRFAARIEFRVMQDEMHDLRLEASAHVLSPGGARTGTSPGEVLSLVTADTDVLGRGVRYLPYIASHSAATVLVAWILLRTDVVLGMAVLVGAPTVLVVVQLLAPRIHRNVEAQQESIARATGMAGDLVKGIRALKGIGAERVAVDRYRALSRTAQHASVRTASSYGRLYGASTALNGLFLAVVAFLAGRLAASGDISIGELIAVVGLAQFLAGPLETLGEAGAVFASSYAAAGRIATHLAAEPLIADGPREPAETGPQLSLRDVRAGAFNGLGLVTSPGELLGVVVPDPVAAELLVELLAGEVPAHDWSGTMALGDVPYADLSLVARRRHLVVAGHRVDVLEGTLRSNIVSPGRDLGPVRLAAVVDAAGVAEVVASSPDGLDRATTSGGGTLSGGQRQRLALARALAADPDVLVLHDPTTAVDAVTEQRLALGLRSLRHGVGSSRATVVVTSSPALLAQADRVLLVVDGAVAAAGTHHELSHDPGYVEAVLR
ncbi:MAG: hypothetical protein JWQ74_844 [Marmoricola sp.]|nr:hypothetical protein [Marmoricola sp.]